MALEPERFGERHLIGEKRQLALGAFLWVEQSDGTGGSVAGVGERLLVFLPTQAVECSENLPRHEHLAAHLDPLRRPGQA